MGPGDFKEWLKRQKGITETDANEGLKYYNQGISEAASRASKSTSTGSAIGEGVLKNIANAAAAGFYDRFAGTQARISVDTIKKIVTELGDIPALNPLTFATNILNGMAEASESFLTDLAKVNDDIISSTRGTAGYVGDISTQSINALNEAIIATTRLGVTVGDFINATESLMTSSERMALYSEETIYAGMEASMAYTKNSKVLLENAENFRNVGLGVGDTAKAIEAIGQRSIKLGLSAKATSETLIGQLGKLNAFGFQGGIQGLGKMVQEAQALKINMEEVFKVADKLYDPESAINLAANLQVVGGAVGDLADPIKLMYDATNNVESLQTSIIGAARSLATYNAEQGRFEVTGANLRRAKAMSDALGISMGELTNMAVKGAAKLEAMSKLNMFPSLTDEQREFVSNISTIKDGKVGFDLPDDMAKKMGITNLQEGFVAIDNLTDDQLIQLKALQESNEKLSTKDIARSQLNATTQMGNVVSAIYLRMMEDGRRADRADGGLNINKKMYEASQDMYNTFDASKLSTKELLNVAKDLAVDNLKGAAKDMYEQIQSKFPDATNAVQDGINSLKKVTKELDLPSLDQMKAKGKELIEKGKESIGELSLNVKVDINSNSAQLAGIVVDELEKSPTLRRDFVSSIVKSSKEYLS
jgi:hypothetical protein